MSSASAPPVAAAPSPAASGSTATSSRSTAPHGTRGAIGDFGAPRNGGRVHEGFDITGACGTPLVVARGGKVAKVGYDPRLYGNFVLINGRKSDENELLRAPDRADAAAQGRARQDRRRASARIGQTGNAAGTPCHLHFAAPPARNASSTPSRSCVTGTPTAERRRACRPPAPDASQSSLRLQYIGPSQLLQKPREGAEASSLIPSEFSRNSLIKGVVRTRGMIGVLGLIVVLAPGPRQAARADRRGRAPAGSPSRSLSRPLVRLLRRHVRAGLLPRDGLAAQLADRRIGARDGLDRPGQRRRRTRPGGVVFTGRHGPEGSRAARSRST